MNTTQRMQDVTDNAFGLERFARAIGYGPTVEQLRIVQAAVEPRPTPSPDPDEDPERWDGMG